jgi:pimeloyl-ACP methyl ester carboxylesterase
MVTPSCSACRQSCALGVSTGPPITAALVVHGSEDSGISLAEVRQWASVLPNARPPVVIDGAPHVSCATHPREVATAIDRFLSELGSV